MRVLAIGMGTPFPSTYQCLRKFCPFLDVWESNDPMHKIQAPISCCSSKLLVLEVSQMRDVDVENPGFDMDGWMRDGC
jgi:hypothetical protein